MRILVCGGRHYRNARAVRDTLDAFRDDTYQVTLIEGRCRSGADRIARLFAFLWGWTCEGYPADWNRYGRRAGPIRNQLMLDASEPDVCIAFPGGNGTADMVRRVRTTEIPLVEVSE